MKETLRKLVKLAKGMVTGKTACRQCGHVVHARHPLKIMRRLGIHHVNAGHEPEPPQDIKQKVDSGYYDD